MSKPTPPKRARTSTTLYVGDMFAFDKMEESVRPRIKFVLNELHSLAKKQGLSPESVDESLAGFQVRVTRRASGNSQGNIDYVYYPEDDPSVKCRSKNDLGKYLGLIEKKPLPPPEDEYDDDDDDGDDFETRAERATATRKVKPVKSMYPPPPPSKPRSAKKDPSKMLAQSLMDDDNKLKEPLRVSKFSVVTALGELDESSLQGTNIYPIGYKVRTLFPSPITPMKDAVYECRIESGPTFVVEHVGAPKQIDLAERAPASVASALKKDDESAKAPSTTTTESKIGSPGKSDLKANEAPSANGQQKKQKDQSPKNNEEEDDEDVGSDGEEEKRDKRRTQPMERNRIFPETISDRMTKLSATGKTPHEAWGNLIDKLETRVQGMLNTFQYMGAAQPPPHVEESVMMTVRDLVDKVEADVAGYRRPTILTNEDLKTNLGDFLFGLNDYRVTMCFQSLPGLDIRPAPKARKVQAESNSKKQTKEMEKKLSKSVFNFAEKFRNFETRAERACDRRLRVENNLSKVFQEKAKKQVTKMITATRKTEANQDQSKRIVALNVLKKLELEILSKVPGQTRLLEDFASVSATTKEFWDFGRLKPDQMLVCPDSTLFGENETGWKTFDPLLVSAWDFCSTFSVTLGICSPESRAPHVAGEYVIEDKLHLRTRAPDFRPSIELDEFCTAFDTCDEKLMAPIHVGLLRLAASAVYSYREDIRLRMETAKKNGHLFLEPGDESDRFGKVVEVMRDVKDGDFVHFLVNGVPITESTWFELARACFSFRRFNQKQLQTPVDAKEAERLFAELAKNATIGSSENGAASLSPVLTSEDTMTTDASTLEYDDEDDVKNRRKTSKKPAWSQILSEVRDMPSNRSARIKDSIVRALGKVPGREKDVRTILKDALDLYQSNTGAKMREKALEAIKYARSGTYIGNGSSNGDDGGDGDDSSMVNGDEGEDETFYSVAIRPMTPLDSHCIRTALANVMKKVGSNSMFEPLLKAIEYKLVAGKFASAVDCLGEIDAVWQRNVRSTRQREQVQKEGRAFQGDFKIYLDQACKENGVSELGGVADLCVVRRLGMTRPHTLFSLYPKTEEDVAIASSSTSNPEPLPWESSVTTSPTTTALMWSKQEGNPSEDWIDRLYKARMYSDLSVEDRRLLLNAVMETALGAEEIRIDIKFREAEIEKAKSKFGNANFLYSIAGPAQVGVDKAETALDEFLEQYQGTLEPCGVPLELIAQLKREIREELISRKRNQRTAYLRVELDRLLAMYEVRPKLLGYDRLDRAYFYFSSLPQTLFVFAGNSPDGTGIDSTVESGRAFEVTRGFMEMVETLDASKDSRDLLLASAIREILPALMNEDRPAIWSKIPEPEEGSTEGNSINTSRQPVTSGVGSLANRHSRKKEVWQDFGPNVGVRVGRQFPFFPDDPSSRSYKVGGFIAAYLPADEEDPALWKMIHDDGDAEDLETAELTEGLTIAESPVVTQAAYFYPFFPDSTAARKVSMRVAKTLAARCFSLSTYESKRLLDLKVTLLCMEKAMNVPWSNSSEHKRFEGMVHTARTWEGLRYALALLEKNLYPQDATGTASSSLLLPEFVSAFTASAATAMAVDTPYLLASRILLLDRAFRYPDLKALKEKKDEEEKQRQEEQKKAALAEKKKAAQEEKERKAKQRQAELEEKRNKQQERATTRRTNRTSRGSSSTPVNTRKSTSDQSSEASSSEEEEEKSEEEEEEEVPKKSSKRPARGGGKRRQQDEEEQSEEDESEEESEEEESEEEEEEVVPKGKRGGRPSATKKATSSRKQSQTSKKRKVVVDSSSSGEEEEEEEEEAPPKRSSKSKSQAKQSTKKTRVVEDEDEDEDEEGDEDEEEAEGGSDEEQDENEEEDEDEDGEEEEEEEEEGDEESSEEEEEDEEVEEEEPPKKKARGSTSSRTSGRVSSGSQKSSSRKTEEKIIKRLPANNQRAIRAARRSAF